jgi:GH24 family phage-related lysozyme (muramidase)|tara:strand:+ start:3300 stop:3458 length:159 start_codon:yes stop_codon:yes gene_type:complete
MGAFDRMVKKLMAQGKSKEAAKKIAYSIGVNKYGKKGMARKAAAGRRNSRNA